MTKDQFNIIAHTLGVSADAKEVPMYFHRNTYIVEKDHYNYSLLIELLELGFMNYDAHSNQTNSHWWVTDEGKKQFMILYRQRTTTPNPSISQVWNMCDFSVDTVVITRTKRKELIDWTQRFEQAEPVAYYKQLTNKKLLLRLLKLSHDYAMSQKNKSINLVSKQY